MTSVPTLGYWDIRGLAEPIRYLLRYAGVPFNDKRYQFGPGKSFAEWASISKPWLPDKQSLGLDFPNIPYYIEGDLKLSQSLTIMRHLARKHGLIATSEPELCRQELAEQQIQDMRISFLYSIAIVPDYKEKTSAYLKDKLIPQLELLTKFLGSNDWLSSKFSYVDILAYETLDWLRLFSPDTIAKFPVLVQYMTRFENLPKIKEYRQSADYKSWPLFGPVVSWGHRK